MRFDWNRARAFLVTAEEGSLSAAARALGMTQPTLGRQVDALEQELGVVLFERAGRGLTLTPTGAALLEHVRGMGEAAGAFSLAASGRHAEIAGPVCISASEMTAALVLPRLMPGLLARAPKLEIEIVATNAASDLKRREADIAVRNFRPTQPDLIARRLREIPVRIYATPGYLSGLPPIRDLTDLRHLSFVGFDTPERLVKALEGFGLSLEKRQFPLVSESFVAAWAMVKEGLGAGMMQEELGDAEPSLVRVLPELELMRMPVWLTAHRELATSPRIRLVFDHLAQHL